MRENLRKFVHWARDAFEGPDGRASHQKLLILYMTLLFTFVVITTGFWAIPYPEPIYHILGGVIVGQSAIRAWQTTKDHEIEKKNRDDDKTKVL